MNGRDELASPSDLTATPQLMGVERGVGGRALNGGAAGGAAAAAPPPVAPPAPPASPDGAEPPRKRARPARPDDAPALRRAILDSHLQRLKALRERFTEQLSELYFLQAGGNMMDYATWRRRPATPQLVAFLEARRPPPAAEQVPSLPSSVTVATSAPVPMSVSAPNLPPSITQVVTSAPVPAMVQVAAPTPIPAPALAPVPIPTPINIPLPAAAAPVSNPSPIPTPTVTPSPTPTPTPGGTPAAPPAAPAPPAPAAAPADEMVEKAKQEAYVARRVAELARAGLWTERRLPRVLEPPRAKSHWDYLLEEMAWLAQDFSHERKWKKQAARKCARAVQKYFQDKALAAQRAEKAQEIQLKKIAAFAAKEIRTFWTNVEKLVEWKRIRRVERARKEALDEQLSYIVDRTERYSRQLAANMAPPGPASTASTSAPATAAPSDDEFTPRGCSDDDEETIAAAEREAGLDAAAHQDEIEALHRESCLDLGDLLPPGYMPAQSPPPSDYSPDDDDDSADDERTIAEQERAERGLDVAAELDELRRDADVDIDELLRRYGTHDVADMDTDADTAATTSTSSTENSDSDSESDTSGTPEEPLEALIQETPTDGSEMKTSPAAATTSTDEAGDSERRVEEASSLAASLQPTGTTLSETTVGTPVPRLLRHALREYQHVGLHWLATMHARGLNGILADEMGLGKTVQTIALLAHLALEQFDWGPHLVVAPTSVVLNWEMEFKKWCPAFKILTYYGTIKERKQKRVGWTKANSFHVCITSYKLVVQDHQSFRRKKWKYLILDEAQNIKNFKSQRWQLLLNFQTERRLLLTGTPLQNSLVELWSLMHFLMPDEFASHSEFREWFAEVGAMAEGARYAEEPLRRLHAVLRPFLLRRLKRDVERQMPRKYERVLMCRLAARQRCLYDDFMSRAKTKESLASGNLLSVINVLMQLRKVCNHPDLFEPRPVTSPLYLGALRLHSPALVMLSEVYERTELAARLGGDLAALEASGAGAFAAHRARHLAPPRRAFEDAADARRRPPPRPPPAPLRIHLRLVPRAAPAAAAPPPPAVALAAAPHSQRVPPPPVARAPPSTVPAARLEARRRAALRRLAACNERRCWRLPLYGADLRAAVWAGPPAVPPRDIADLLTELHDIIDRFSICCATVRAEPVSVCAGAAGAAGAEGARDWRRRCARAEAAAAERARGALALLHAPASRQAVAFPHPSLLQYDCGKLQTLAMLLRRLKAGGHRVLIFTQMTRVLDVLEAFLSMHGYAYLRLDGATRVDRRQPLVDRFNADPRIFAFILSTRSGGVGLNLTGADSVVFYDSDWNPTMDAQAQDRCHRIGQTRDVHVYRLVTAATVEENILRKAEQKRALGHLAIEDGHFTTSYLRGANIKELFGAEAAVSESAGGGGSGGGELESALAAAEDEADAAAARAARAEAQGELAEFDESVPLDDEPRLARDARDTRDPHAAELAALMSQLTPIEKYAMRVVESGEAASEAERAALGEMRRQLREWEEARRQLRRESPAPRSPSPPLTYCRGTTRAEVWVNAAGDRMPVWCPPTPPAGDGDVYCEAWVRPLYRPGAATEAMLPPVHRREPRAARDARRPRPAARAPPAPPSLFERGGPRPRPRPRPPHTPAAAHTPLPEWSPAEDAALRRALRLQRLPSEPPPAIAPNWEWVAELVGEAARAYRSARVCRDRHDALADPERARRRHRRPPAARRRLDDERPRPPLHRLDAVRDAAERRRAAPKRRVDDPPHRNPKHAQLLADHGIDYDVPPTPVEVAARRADRIAREKLKAAAPQTSSASAAPPAVSAAPAPVPVSVAQRVLVAAHGAGGKPDARRLRAATSEAPRAAVASSAAASAPTAQLLYRQQAFTARHLKILHQTVGPAAQGGAAGTSADGASLRKIQLQQVSLRRAPAALAVAPPAHPAHAAHAAHAAPAAHPAPATHPAHAAAAPPGASHVVVAHIAAPAPAAHPAAHPASHPASPAPRPPDSRQ